jgi:hypothetical protein
MKVTELAPPDVAAERAEIQKAAMKECVLVTPVRYFCFTLFRFSVFVRLFAQFASLGFDGSVVLCMP